MAMLAGILFFLPGCILDINLDPLRDPGSLEDLVDEDKVDPGDETGIDTFDPIPDDSIQPEQYDCYITCQDGWSALCNSTISWCVSAWRGDGTCCDAYSSCQELGAMPGIWPNAGPYEYIVPADFASHISANTIVISNCVSSGSNIGCNISCFDSIGTWVDNEYHDFSTTGGCSGETCVVFSSTTCPGKNIGCGTACVMPYWCWKQ
jgi:hypothetical protein